MNNKKIGVIEKMLKKRQSNRVSLSVSERKKILNHLKLMLIEREEDLLKALKIDLRKSNFEAYASEFAVLLNEIDYVLKHLNKWRKEKRSYRFKIGTIEKVRTRREAFGTVLIISPWNYPLQLALMPVISAISAGNPCVIKPSEHAPATGKVLEEIIDQYFIPEKLIVITGDAEIAKQLIDLPFNLLFFTGSEEVGNLVYQQAATQQMPVIMELGGKNPCIIDETGFSDAYIEEIVWGKFLNAGQTCIAPDTLFVHESIYEQTLKVLKEKITQFYGEDSRQSLDYGRLVHENHYNRLENFLTEGSIYYGGKTNQEDLFIEPTLLVDVNPESYLMKEEIFGPILPVIPYTDLNELLESGDLQNDALVVYLFSKKTETLNLLNDYMKSTISMNQVIQHVTNPNVAFGGVGRSGFGAYHGKAGFKACSYERANVKPYTYKHLDNKYPPYDDKDLPILKRLRKWII